MTDRELMQHPLPCPFCGGDNIGVMEGSSFRWMVACCNRCGAQSGEVRMQTIGEGSKQVWLEKAQKDAITEWNYRARLAQPEPEQINYEEWNYNPMTGEPLFDKREQEPDKYLMEIECTKCGAKQDGVLTVKVPQRESKGLTDEEIAEISVANQYDDFCFARAIEAKLKEKNGN